MGNMCGGGDVDDSVDPSDDSQGPTKAKVGKATQRNLAKAEERRKNGKGETQLKTGKKKKKKKKKGDESVDPSEINFKNPVGGDDSDDDDWANGTHPPARPPESPEIAREMAGAQPLLGRNRALIRAPIALRSPPSNARRCLLRVFVVQRWQLSRQAKMRASGRRETNLASMIPTRRRG